MFFFNPTLTPKHNKKDNIFFCWHFLVVRTANATIMYLHTRVINFSYLFCGDLKLNCDLKLISLLLCRIYDPPNGKVLSTAQNNIVCVRASCVFSFVKGLGIHIPILHDKTM